MRYQQYQVAGHGAHATVDGPYGRVRTFLLRGALVPGDAPEVPHLLSVGLIRPVGQPAAVPAPQPATAPDGAGTAEPGEGAETPNTTTATTPPESGDGQQAAPDSEVAEKRAAARAKLPADGSAPHANSGQPVWVEYLVSKGYDYDALRGEEKDTLRDLAQQVQ